MALHPCDGRSLDKFLQDVRITLPKADSHDSIIFQDFEVLTPKIVSRVISVRTSIETHGFNYQPPLPRKWLNNTPPAIEIKLVCRVSCTGSSNERDVDSFPCFR